MALAIDASTPALASATTGTAVSTAAFTTPTAVFLLAMVARDSPGTPTGNTGTITGAGLAWTLAGRKSDTGSNQIAGGTGQGGIAEMWWAYSSAALTSVQVTDTQSLTNQAHGLKVIVITGAESTWGGAISAGGSANTGASPVPSATLTTTAANSWVFSCSNDWNASGAGTAGSGQTIIDSSTISGTGTGITAHYWRQTAVTATSGTSVTNNLTAPSGQTWNELILEVRASTGAAPTPPRRLQNPRAAVIRASSY